MHRLTSAVGIAFLQVGEDLNRPIIASVTHSARADGNLAGGKNGKD